MRAVGVDANGGIVVYRLIRPEGGWPPVAEVKDSFLGENNRLLFEKAAGTGPLTDEEKADLNAKLIARTAQIIGATYQIKRRP